MAKTNQAQLLELIQAMGQAQADLLRRVEELEKELGNLQGDVGTLEEKTSENTVRLNKAGEFGLKVASALKKAGLQS